MRPSLVVYDDEVPGREGSRQLPTNQWGAILAGVAMRKGMPEEVKFYTKRNALGDGTVFEWEESK